jgi:hypothetical protein
MIALQKVDSKILIDTAHRMECNHIAISHYAKSKFNNINRPSAIYRRIVLLDFWPNLSTLDLAESTVHYSSLHYLLSPASLVLYWP